MQEEEFHRGEVIQGLLTAQKSHLAEVLHLKTTGGWEGRSQSTFCTLTLSCTMLPAPANSTLCTKLPQARWTTGLTSKAILCSYSCFCPGGLFLLLFYSSLPEQSPAPSLAFTQIIFITCREGKISPILQHSSCFTSAGHCWSEGCCRHWQRFP